MCKLTVLCDYTILDDFKYSIYEDDELTLSAFVDFTAPFKDFFKNRELYQSKITVYKKENELLQIYRHIQTPISEDLFSIFIDKNKYVLKEKRSFKVPDFYIPMPSGTLSITGKINIQYFEIFHNNIKCGSIKGSLEKNKKKYVLEYDPIFKNSRELFLSCLLIIDNLYHDY